MAVKLDGSTAYLEHAAKVVSAFPFSMMVWVSADTTGTSQAWIVQQQSNADRHALLWLDSNGVNKYASLRNPGNSVNAVKNTPPDPNTTMRLGVAVFTSVSSRTVYYGSSTGVTDTVTMIDDTTNHDRLTVGAWRYNSGAAGLFCNGSVAEAHIFNVALTATDVTNLLADSVKPEAITGWVDGWMLNPSGSAGSAAPATFTSIGGTRTLTTVGTATVSSQAHPISRVAAAILSGTVYLDDVAPSGSFYGAGSSVLSGVVYLDNVGVSGSMGTAPGTLTSEPLRLNNGFLLASVTLAFVAVYNLAGDLVVRQTNVTTNASGIFTITASGILSGIFYRVDWETAAGQRRMPLALAA